MAASIVLANPLSDPSPTPYRPGSIGVEPDEEPVLPRIADDIGRCLGDFQRDLSIPSCDIRREHARTTIMAGLSGRSQLFADVYRSQDGPHQAAAVIAITRAAS